MKRVTLRVESLDGRILPSGSSVGIELSHPGVAVIDDGGSKPGATGEGIQVFGSKPTAAGGSNSIGDTNTGIELFGGSKPTASGGIGINATDGVELFGGSKPVTNGGSNSIGDTGTGIELFGTGYKPGTTGG